MLCSKEVTIPTSRGLFKAFSVRENDKEHFVLYQGDRVMDDCVVRIHSECLTGDVFGSEKCDCGRQLDHALDVIATDKKGILIYLRQEGRGIGLFNKIEAYFEQEQGADTVEGNTNLGLPIDARDYTICIDILNSFSVKKIKLITHNPHKLKTLQMNFDVDLIKVKPCVNMYNEKYIHTKINKMGHLI
jgi:GTP cyclohydrolase II